MWFGLSIMVVMIVGLIWWCVWAVRRDPAQTSESTNAQGHKEG